MRRASETFERPQPKTTSVRALSVFSGKPQAVSLKGEVVLEEEEYLKNMEKLITRDFFPALHNNPITVENGNATPGSAKFTIDSMHGQLDPELQDISLNEYLSKFTSEDNASLAKLMEKDREVWKQKFWWIGKAEEEAKQKQLALEADASQGKLNNMIAGTKENQLQITAYEGQNNFMFMPKSFDKQTHSYSDAHSSLAKKIHYENTRFDQEEESKKLANEIFTAVRYFRDLGTPDLAGIERRATGQRVDLDDLHKKPDDDDESETGKKIKEEKERIRGYTLLKMPSPSPNLGGETPMMTWGEIQSTPIRLPEDQREKNYNIPRTPNRDQMKIDLPNKIAKQKKMQKLMQKQSMKEMLSPALARRNTDSIRGTPLSMSSKSIRKDSSIFTAARDKSKTTTPVIKKAEDLLKKSQKTQEMKKSLLNF